MKTKKSLSLTIVLVMLMLNVAKATIHTVQVANFSFTPSVLNINSGDTVRWVWVSGTHTTTSTSVPPGATAWDHPMNSGSTQFDEKFTIAGTYDYHCSIHPTMMTGTITVASTTGLPDVTLNSYNVKTYPSPFTDNLSISFTIPESGETKISIYDITGKLVKELANTDYEKGSYIINWDGKNGNGEIVKHGLYFYMIERKSLSKKSGKIIFGS